MSEKIKIETVNKISQIYSVDVHCNPLIVDVRLDVEKSVSATSEKMRDEESAKANAYTKAKAEYKVDVIVDPSFVIRMSYSNLFFAFIAFITFGLVKLGLRFVVTISGYAGYYTNPKSYYDHQKLELSDLANAIETAFSNTPKLTSDERKVIEKLRTDEIKTDRMSPNEQEIWKKYTKIQNKTGQALAFKSIFYPNTDLSDYDQYDTTSATTSLLNPKNKRSKLNLSFLAPVIKFAVVAGILYTTFIYASNYYKKWKGKKEAELAEVEMHSANINYNVQSIENGFLNVTKGSVDSLSILALKWEYNVEEYPDSVQKYDKIRETFLQKYSSEYMPKVLEMEAAKIKQDFIENVYSYIGSFNGSYGSSTLLITIDNISPNLEVKGSNTFTYIDGSSYTRPLAGKVILSENEIMFELNQPSEIKTDGVFVFRHDKNMLEGKWISYDASLPLMEFSLYKYENYYDSY